MERERLNQLSELINRNILFEENPGDITFTLRYISTALEKHKDLRSVDQILEFLCNITLYEQVAKNVEKDVVYKLVTFLHFELPSTIELALNIINNVYFDLLPWIHEFLLDKGIISIMLKLLSSQVKEVRNKSCVFLTSFANHKKKNLVEDEVFLKVFCEKILIETSLGVTETMSILLLKLLKVNNRHEDVPLSKLSTITEAVLSLLKNDCPTIVQNGCSILYNITKFFCEAKYQILFLKNDEMVLEISKLVAYENTVILHESLKVVLNLTLSTEIILQMMTYEFISILKELLLHHFKKIRSLVCWIFSNVVAQGKCIEEMIDMKVYKIITDLIIEDIYIDVKKEAIWIIGNFTRLYSGVMLKRIIEILRCVTFILLDVRSWELSDGEIIIVVALQILLDYVKKMPCYQELEDELERYDFGQIISKIRELIEHNNISISLLARDIIINIEVRTQTSKDLNLSR
jgi:hypothetical protein